MRETFVFRLSSLGDLVLCTPLLLELQRETDRCLHFVTEARFAPFVRASFPIENLDVIEIPGEPRGLLKFIRAGFYAGRRLPRDTVGPVEIYDLHGVLKSRLWRWAFRIAALSRGHRVRVRATAKKSLRRILSVWLGRDLLGPRFIFREHLNLLHRTSFLSPQLKHPPRPAHTAPQMLIAPDAQHWKKRWLLEHWENFITRILTETRTEITLVGGAEVWPTELLDRIQAQAPNRVRNQLGNTTLADLATIASQHDIAICGNSAWQHIAEAVGTPVVSLAGPIVAGFGFSPWHSRSRELARNELACRPCTRHGGGKCRLSGDDFHACMKRILPEDVWQSLRAQWPGTFS